MDIFIREVFAADAMPVNLLSRQLGYALSVEQTAQNIEAVVKSKDHTAFVAILDDKIIGWIGVSYAIMLEVMPHCEINGLVIEEGYRGKGIGKLLIEKASQWAREKGVNKLSLHMNVNRKDAHSFYEHLGFKNIKQQTNFVMTI